ncbi:FtsX-like permease family protein [Pseudoalteromonas sp. J010]|uniref:ABC transporter permease n=1 Tax=Pseudoalteromonas sp. J010 TaxID=998465 RepID=UPI000F64E0FC|nr:ABC transporter permease [Pseudoalteromonas sp. J010]RRS09733.1 FtsX-like permease family protein [Pseudoalteromonas sp. J010]
MVTHSINMAWQRLKRHISYTVTIILTLGLALGALVSTYNLNYQLLAAPLPYPDAERLMLLRGALVDDNNEIKQSNFIPHAGSLTSYEKQPQFPEIESIALQNISIDVEQSLPSSPTFNIGAITPEYMQLLDAPMALGRYFSSDEGLDSQQPVAMISYSVWQQYFAGNPDVLEKTVVFKGVSFKIIGVTASQFDEPVLSTPNWHTDVWLTYDYNDSPAPQWQRNNIQTYQILKLHKSADSQTAQLSLENWFNEQLHQQTRGMQDFANSRVKLELIPFKTRIVGDASQVSLMMLLGSIVLLLIALSNICNLVLSRAVEQQKNFAVQAALGARPSHLFHHIVTELGLLFTCAAAISLVVATAIIWLLKSGMAGPLARLQTLQLELHTVVFALMTSAALCLMLAWIVSRQLNYQNIIRQLQSSGKGTGVQISATTRNLLISFQLLICLSLLTVCLGVFQTSWQHLQRETGIKEQNTYQVALNLGTLLQQMTLEERRQLLLSALDSLRALPQVEHAGIGGYPPISYWVPGFSSRQMQFEPGIKKNSFEFQSTAGTTSYFNAFGTKLIDGRAFTMEEAINNESVVIINQYLARQLRERGQVLGAKLYSRNSQNSVEVIGVVDDIYLPNQPNIARIFIPAIPTGYPFIMIETKANTGISKAEINQLLVDIHPQMRVYNFQSTTTLLATHLQRDRVASIFTLVLSVIALVLAAIGIYGVCKYNIALRRFELGVRMSIGATPITVLILILKDNLRPLLIAVCASACILLSISALQDTLVPNTASSIVHWLVSLAAVITLVTGVTLASARDIIARPALHALRGE